MQKLLLLVISAAILTTLSSYSAQEDLIAVNPEVIYRYQTKDEAFSFVMYLVKKLSWFNNNSYTVSLPMHKDFEDIYQRSELIDEKDESFLRSIFYKEVYDASKFDITLEVVRQTDDVIKKALQKLAVLRNNWGFKIKQKYDIVLTLYGPGGSYWLTDEVGKITVKINEGVILEPKKYAKTIVHEIVHIGIEENIVQKYSLNHWEKERLVDLICSFYLEDLLPNYPMQETADKKIDSFIDKQVVIENLPVAIETFIAQCSRAVSV